MVRKTCLLDGIMAGSLRSDTCDGVSELADENICLNRVKLGFGRESGKHEGCYRGLEDDVLASGVERPTASVRDEFEVNVLGWTCEEESKRIWQTHRRPERLYGN